jgi:hypothetical protein
MEETFNERTAFQTITGTYPDLRELYGALGRLRWDNLHLLPVGYGVGELYELGRRRKWIVDNEDGSFKIEVPR